MGGNGQGNRLIAMEKSTRLDMDHVTISSFRSPSLGGVIAANLGGNRINLDHVTMTDNGGTLGGCIYIWEGGKLSVTNSVFMDNYGVQTSAMENKKILSQGGVICSLTTPTYVKNCTFSRNTAQQGGAIHVRFADVDIEDSQFIANTCTKDKNGAAIFFHTRSTTRTKHLALNGETIFAANEYTNGNDGKAIYVTSKEKKRMKLLIGPHCNIDDDQMKLDNVYIHRCGAVCNDATIDKNYEFDSIEYDMVDATVSQGSPFQVGYQIIDNTQGSADQSIEFTAGKTITESTSISHTVGASITVGTSCGVEAMGISAGGSVEVTASYEYSYGKESSEEVTKEANFVCTAPAGKMVTCTVDMTMVTIEAPYKMMWRNKDNSACSCETEGIQTGISGTQMTMHIAEE